MPAKVVQSVQARRDVRDHSVYLRRRSARAAKNFLQALKAAYAFLADWPDIAPLWDPEDADVGDVRIWPVSSKFDQYLIFYCHVRNTVRVLRVRHAAQDLSHGF